MLQPPNEKEFIEHFSRISRSGVILAGIIGIVLYDLFSIVDYVSSREVYKEIWLIRLGVTGAIVVLLALIGSPFGRRHFRGMTLFMALGVTLSVIWIFALANPKTLPREITGISITILFCMAGLRLLLREAIIYSVLVTAVFSWLVSSRTITQDVFTAYCISIPAVLAVGLAVVYITEFYARKSFTDEKTIELERAKADRLLFNTFPAEIALQLKDTQGNFAQKEENTTVMFCDIIGFTAACSSMSPEGLVTGLNHIFSTLDRLTKEHQCEKIKTIGDAYMAVSGVPKAVPDHAVRIVNLALSIMKATPSLTLNGAPLKIRIGIHSGPVVAGVIGESRFAYDLWGDTVNTASRMESTAQENSIQVTEATKLLIDGKFALEKLPAIQIKGKGLMETWQVIRATDVPQGEMPSTTPDLAA